MVARGLCFIEMPTNQTVRWCPLVTGAGTVHVCAQNVSAATTGAVLGLGGQRPPQSSFENNSHVLTIYAEFALLSTARGSPCANVSCNTPKINTHVNYRTCHHTMPPAILCSVPIKTDFSTPTATHQPSITITGSNPRICIRNRKILRGLPHCSASHLPSPTCRTHHYTGFQPTGQSVWA